MAVATAAALLWPDAVLPPSCSLLLSSTLSAPEAPTCHYQSNNTICGSNSDVKECHFSEAHNSCKVTGHSDCIGQISPSATEPVTPRSFTDFSAHNSCKVAGHSDCQSQSEAEAAVTPTSITLVHTGKAAKSPDTPVVSVGQIPQSAKETVTPRSAT